MTERGLQNEALLAPSRTLSQILGLRGHESHSEAFRSLAIRSDPRLTIPPWPDLVAANSPKESLQQVPLAPQKLCRHLARKKYCTGPMPTAPGGSWRPEAPFLVYAHRLKAAISARYLRMFEFGRAEICLLGNDEEQSLEKEV